MPVYQGVHPNVVQNLINFDIDSQVQKNELCTQFVRGSLITQNRNLITRTALEHEDDWLLFWDADVEIRGRDFLHRMLKTAKEYDAPVVGLAVRLKTLAAPFNCGMKEPGGYRNYTHIKDLEGAQEVDAVGTGCMLINLSWLRKNLVAPYFQVIDTALGAFPEDWNFCEKVKEKGGKVVVEPNVQTVHWGEYAWI